MTYPGSMSLSPGTVTGPVNCMLFPEKAGHWWVCTSVRLWEINPLPEHNSKQAREIWKKKDMPNNLLDTGCAKLWFKVHSNSSNSNENGKRTRNLGLTGPRLASILIFFKEWSVSSGRESEGMDIKLLGFYCKWHENPRLIQEPTVLALWIPSHPAKWWIV